MPENLMNSAHKSTTQAYRDNYDRIFDRVLGLFEPYGPAQCIQDWKPINRPRKDDDGSEERDI